MVWWYANITVLVIHTHADHLWELSGRGQCKHWLGDPGQGTEEVGWQLCYFFFVSPSKACDANLAQAKQVATYRKRGLDYNIA